MSPVKAAETEGNSVIAKINVRVRSRKAPGSTLARVEGSVEVVLHVVFMVGVRLCAGADVALELLLFGCFITALAGGAAPFGEVHAKDLVE